VHPQSSLFSRRLHQSLFASHVTCAICCCCCCDCDQRKEKVFVEQQKVKKKEAFEDQE